MRIQSAAYFPASFSIQNAALANNIYFVMETLEELGFEKRSARAEICSYVRKSENFLCFSSKKGENVFIYYV